MHEATVLTLVAGTVHRFIPTSAVVLAALSAEGDVRGNSTRSPVEGGASRSPAGPG